MRCDVVMSRVQSILTSLTHSLTKLDSICDYILNLDPILYKAANKMQLSSRRRNIINVLKANVSLNNRNPIP